MIEYLVVYEKAGKNYSAFCPDLPGCVATGATKKAAEKNIKSAISMHLEELKEEHRPLPSAKTSAEYVHVRL